MTEPQRPKDPPTEPKKVDHSPGADQNGIPEGADQAEAKGLPHSDRQATETAGKSG